MIAASEKPGNDCIREAAVRPSGGTSSPRITDIDLGRFSPQFDEPVEGCPGFTTQTVRYLIALTDAKTGLCQGVVLCPGRRLAEHFVYVAERSFKCQRSIPMGFFDRFEGQAVFNPAYP